MQSTQLSYRSVLRRLATLVCCFCLAVTGSFADTGAMASPDLWWGWEFLGRMHPLVVHFPIALLVIAAIMEATTLKRFEGFLRPGISWLVYAGAGAGLLAALFGWLLAESGNYGGDLLENHQNAGIATMLLGLFAAFALRRALRTKRVVWVRLYRSALFVAGLGIFVTGHYGGSLTHGRDYLVGVTPWAPTELYADDIGGETNLENFDWASFSSTTDSLSAQQALELNVAARTILAHRCYQCHSSDKAEGGLRLDQKEFVFQGGDSGPSVQPGDARGSELVRRITLPPGHKEAMPGKGKPLDATEIDLIKLWIDRGAPWPDHVQGIFKVADLQPRNPTLPDQVPGMENPIDRWVNTYFKEQGLDWPEPVDDRTFLRRAYFDIIGLPPTAEEIEHFEGVADGNKRAYIVDELLAKSTDYATHWTTFWNDLLRNDYTGTGYITNGRSNISDWLFRALENNMPYDQFVRELVDPDERSKGFIRGIEWRGAVNSSQTTAMQAAQNVSQALLGLNLKCASCHDSFISDWKLTDAYAFANIFSQTPLEINRCDIPTGEMADTRFLWSELGTITEDATVAQKSNELATLLTKPENGRLYRTLVNRVWAQLMGRGIISPTDEMDNEPWSQDLLDWLAVYFVEQGRDIKKLIALIVSSKTYQLPSVAVADPASINARDFVFRGMLKRKLTAEQFADAISTAVHPMYPVHALKYNPLGSADEYAQRHAFVRAALVQNDPFLTALGRPSRENVTSVRESHATLLQAMELTNGALLNEILGEGAARWTSTHTHPGQLVEAVYRKALGRTPTAGEREVAVALLGDGVATESVQDLLWAVVLLPEFQFIE